MHRFRSSLAGLMAMAAVWPAGAQAQGNSTVYRCPGPPVLYTDTIGAAEAKEKGCRTIEGAPITVIQGNRPRTGAPVPASGARPADSRIDPAQQRARDGDARRILEAELKKEEEQLAAMQKDYNALPGGYSAGLYIAGQCIEAALQVLGDKADDRKALAETLHQVSLTDTPRGSVKFDRYGNVVGDVFIRKCERKNGQLVNTVVRLYPNVSQFWTYDEKEFLAAPVYGRDFPPAKNLEP